MTAHLGARGLSNLEGHTDFDITWPWLRPEGLRPGSTAVLRVKNEAPSLPFVLPPLLRACEFVLLVDNGSDDGTPDVARETAAKHGLGDKPVRELVEHPVVMERVRRIVDAVNGHLATYARIKRFAVLPADFTQESGELTPTLKVKRRDVRQKYAAVIDSLYRD